MCARVWQWWCGEGHAPKKEKKKSGALCLWRQLSHPHPPPTTAAFLFQRQNDPSPLLLTLLVLPHPTTPLHPHHHLSASPRCLRCAPTYLASFSFSSHSTTRCVSCQCQLSAARSLHMEDEKKEIQVPVLFARFTRHAHNYALCFLSARGCETYTENRFINEVREQADNLQLSTRTLT